VFHLTLDGPIGVHATTHDKPAASLGSRKGKYHAERVAITWLCGPGLAGCDLLLGYCIDDVGFDPTDPGGSKPFEYLVLDLASQLRTHLIDRPPQATP